jgi:cytochrome c oxidase subunit 1
VFLGFLLTFIPQFFLGNWGMPRRYYSYPAQYEFLNVLSTGGAYLLAGALLLTLVNLVVALRYGARAGRNPWGSRTYEWDTPSPPLQHNFPEPPVVDRGPYAYELSEEEAHARTTAV